jgi:hypothetical protein
LISEIGEITDGPVRPQEEPHQPLKLGFEPVRLVFPVDKADFVSAKLVWPRLVAYPMF